MLLYFRTSSCKLMQTKVQTACFWAALLFLAGCSCMVPVLFVLVSVLRMTSGSALNCFASCSRKQLLKSCNVLNYWNEPWEDNTCRMHLRSQSWLFSLQKLVNELSCLGGFFIGLQHWCYRIENRTVVCFKVMLALVMNFLKINRGWFKATALPNRSISEQSVQTTLTSQGFNR